MYNTNVLWQKKNNEERQLLIIYMNTDILLLFFLSFSRFICALLFFLTFIHVHSTLYICVVIITKERVKEKTNLLMRLFFTFFRKIKERKKKTLFCVFCSLDKRPILFVLICRQKIDKIQK
jgi:hypothetical protein